MDPLFETSTTITYRQFSRFFTMVQVRVNKTPIALAVIIAVLLIAAPIRQDIRFVLAALVIVAVYALFFAMTLRKAWKANPALHDAQSKLQFYPDTFEKVMESGNRGMRYEQLNRIVETKNNFYLMLDEQQGLILIKADCPDGLAEFLRSKMKKK